MTIWRKILRTAKTITYTAVALSAVYFAAVYAFNPEGRKQTKTLEAELERLHGANIALAERNERLRLQIAAIRYDDRYLEHVAREDLGLVSKGEVVYRFVNVSSPAKSQALDAAN